MEKSKKIHKKNKYRSLKICGIIMTAVLVISCVLSVPCSALSINTAPDRGGTMDEYGFINFDSVTISNAWANTSNSSNAYVSPWNTVVGVTSMMPENLYNYRDFDLGHMTDTIQTDNVPYSTPESRGEYYVTLRSRTLTDWFQNPYETFNAYEYNIVNIPQWADKSKTGGDIDAYVTTLNIKSSAIVANVPLNPETIDGRTYELVTLGCNTYNLRMTGGATYSVEYDIVIPKYEKFINESDLANSSIGFGFETIKHVEKTQNVRFGGSFQLINDTDIPWEELTTKFDETELEYLPVIFTNINIYCDAYVYDTVADYTDRENGIIEGQTIFEAENEKVYFSIGMPEETMYNHNVANDLTAYDWIFDVPATIENVDINDISIVDWLITQMSSVLALEIFPFVTVGGILWFIIGISMLFFVLKMFLGG